jgi:O-antigen ligase
MERKAWRSLGGEDVLLLSAVLGLPWFFGGVNQDAYRGAAAVIAVAAGWALVRRGARGLGFGRGLGWLLPAFVLLGFAFLQAAPLPRALVARLSPNAASIQTRAFGPEAASPAAWLRAIEAEGRALAPEGASAVAPAAGALEPAPEAEPAPKFFTLSLYPSATFESACWFAALLLAFLLVHKSTADERLAAAYRTALFAFFGLLALQGILNHYTAPLSLLWLRDAPPLARPFGPYVNPSHFAGVMELGVPWLLGYGLFALLGSDHTRRSGGILALAAAVLGGGAALLSASKMAALTIGVASLILIATAFIASRGRVRSVILAGAASVAVLLGVVALFGPLRNRIVDFEATYEGGVSQNLRVLAWQAGVRMVADYPLTGSGFSTVAEVIPSYLPRGESGTWEELHNDYLEVVVAGGAIAVALVSWLTVVFGWRVVRSLRLGARRGRFLPGLGLSLGLIALAVHETVDFNLQIPANALLFVVLAAIAVAPLTREGNAA